MIERITLDEFVQHYITAMLWAENDEGGHPLDDNYDWTDISPEAMERIREDCQKFLERAEKLIALASEDLARPHPCDSFEYAAHDFWLTRNGHGVGFWDGDWDTNDDGEEDAIATELTAIAKSFRGCHPYVGDDWLIYFL